MRIVTIVGARPQFVKLAPLIRAFRECNRRKWLDHVIVHTGQHYDAGLSAVFFEELELPRPDYNLEVGSGPHGHQTGRMLEGVERALLETRPDMVLVFGDTNSTLAGAVAASKLRIGVAHIEAGLRSYNRKMPEEINRIIADHVSDLLLAPTAAAMENLRREGLGERSALTGDLMYEGVLLGRNIARERSRILETLGIRRGTYGIATVHRSENTEDPVRLRAILDALNEIAVDNFPLVFPAHPRTRKLLLGEKVGWRPESNLRIVEPVGYFDMLHLLSNARVILTDSGGLQKEAFFVGCPCVTLRDETEWNETVIGGGNILVGSDPARIMAAVGAWQERYPSGGADFSEGIRAFCGSERASEATVDAVRTFLDLNAGVTGRRG